TIVCDTEQDDTTKTIKQCTYGLGSFGSLTGGFFKFHCFRFPFRNQFLKFLQKHPSPYLNVNFGPIINAFLKFCKTFYRAMGYSIDPTAYRKFSKDLLIEFSRLFCYKCGS